MVGILLSCLIYLLNNETVLITVTLYGDNSTHRDIKTAFLEHFEKQYTRYAFTEWVKTLKLS